MKRSTHFHDFRSLSVKDLLEVREAYHVHLAHLDNVYATAIGRYLIRDEDPNAKSAGVLSDRKDLGARTLVNSSPREWSWPCILVFVEQWADPSRFAGGEEADSLVPRFLYLPDGRVAPTCVVEVKRGEKGAELANPPTFPSDLVGGGYPVLTNVQGRQHLGSIGCMVTDGDRVFALTNRHVVGNANREVFTRIHGMEQRLGIAHDKEIGKVPFQKVYEGWPGERVMLNMDAGLLLVDSVKRWTAQVYGIGEIGDVWDLNTTSYSLDLINCPVRAYGAASGPMSGRILGLFYRYKSVGGYEYISDLLIAPRNPTAPLNNRPGNSGTIWFEDPPPPPPEMDATKPTESPHKAAPAGPARKLRPIAIEWGGQEVLSPSSLNTTQFALATSLSQICRLLDVELISSWNVGHVEYWGEIGHVKIGALGCELIDEEATPDLAQLMLANQTNVGIGDSKIGEGLEAHKPKTFAPLADVADLVWRFTRKADDESNHFADMDVDGRGKFAGQTLLSLCKQQKNVDPDVWNEFYEAIGEDRRGALPIRVWQIFDLMVEFAAKNKIDEFVCAAGIVAHYIGDACQPLHISKFHHGRDLSDKKHAKVHSVYETVMIKDHAGDLMELINTAAQNANHAPAISINGKMVGQNAAFAVVQLMQRTVDRLPPLKIVDLFDSHMGHGQTDIMWETLKDDTAECIADGAHTLARVWEAAWRKGRAGKPQLTDPAASDQDTLMGLYNRRTFLPSFKLQDLTLKNGKIVAASQDDSRESDSSPDTEDAAPPQLKKKKKKKNARR